LIKLSLHNGTQQNSMGREGVATYTSNNDTINAGQVQARHQQGFACGF
jgi:hypothetical protein